MKDSAFEIKFLFWLVIFNFFPRCFSFNVAEIEVEVMDIMMLWNYTNEKRIEKNCLESENIKMQTKYTIVKRIEKNCLSAENKKKIQTNCKNYDLWYINWL